MRRFTRLSGVAAAVAQAHIDTDKILAGRFLKTVKREGLGQYLFYGLRFDERGAERPDFVLNRHPWRAASILVSLENFGCGSSREHAPWALSDFGIHAILAPSFADIFRTNCYKNGILPVSLPRPIIDRLIEQADDPATASMAIDLAAQRIVTTTGERLHFEIAPENKERLLLGLDEISGTERVSDQIAAFEAGIRYCSPPIPLSL